MHGTYQLVHTVTTVRLWACLNK